jgi:predicted RNase H-like HicB family nuclease
MREFPLLFTIRELISGNGFLAGVIGQGRCLMVNEGEEEGWWIYGVQPGGIAASGKTPEEAYLRYIIALRNLFADLASQSSDFRTFQTSVETFFAQIDREDEGRWKVAVGVVRTGADVDSPVSELPRQQAETPVSVEVVEVELPDELTPAWNSSDSFAVPLAA